MVVQAAAAAACASLSSGAIALAAWQELRDRKTKRFTREAGLFALQLRYLVVYGLAIAGERRLFCLKFERWLFEAISTHTFCLSGDWLQGPYFYKVYQEMSLDNRQIQILFVVGYASSCLSGPFVGSGADRYGRRLFAIIYFLLYTMSCALIHIKQRWALFLGRAFSGVATSLLYSTFDSWLVKEHANHGFTEEALAGSFRIAQLVNSLVAIVAGLVAEALVDRIPSSHKSTVTLGGACAPFELAAMLLLSGSITARCMWAENRGAKRTKEKKEKESYVRGSVLPMLLLGAVVCLFEGTIYTNRCPVNCLTARCSISKHVSLCHCLDTSA